MKRLIYLLVPIVLMAQYPQPPNGLLCNGQPCTNPGNPGGVVFTNAEYNIGTVTTSATIDPAHGNRQRMTLTSGDTASLNFVQPVGQTISIQVEIDAPASGSGQISGGYWPSGSGFTTTPPTLNISNGGFAYMTCYLNGTRGNCILSQ